jgi:hypothetical protein
MAAVFVLRAAFRLLLSRGQKGAGESIVKTLVGSTRSQLLRAEHDVLYVSILQRLAPEWKRSSRSG